MSPLAQETGAVPQALELTSAEKMTAEAPPAALSAKINAISNHFNACVCFRSCPRRCVWMEPSRRNHDPL